MDKTRNCTGTACGECKWYKDDGYWSVCLAPGTLKCPEGWWEWSEQRGCEVFFRGYPTYALARSINKPGRPCPHYEPNRLRRLRDWLNDVLTWR